MDGVSEKVVGGREPRKFQGMRFPTAPFPTNVLVNPEAAARTAQ
jgi:hypothetical protein